MIVWAETIQNDLNNQEEKIYLFHSLYKFFRNALKSITVGYKCKGKWKNSKTNIYLVWSNLKHLKHWQCIWFLYIKHDKSSLNSACLFVK